MGCLCSLCHVAEKVFIQRTDDLDGSVLEAASTETIGWRGFSYSLDLSQEHLAQLEEVLQPWLSASHRQEKIPAQRGQKKKPNTHKTTVDGRTHATHVRNLPSGLTKEERATVREWGRANGWPVKDRGVPSKELINAWKEATNG